VLGVVPGVRTIRGDCEVTAPVLHMTPGRGRRVVPPACQVAAVRARAHVGDKAERRRKSGLLRTALAAVLLALVVIAAWMGGR
jgi:hypothetical protein